MNQDKPSSGFPQEFESIAPDFVTNEKGLKNFANKSFYKSKVLNGYF